ncbi:Entomoglyceroporin-1 [Rhyzopertha dominica]|nr:Entomoglyceroporin-1 [Rhyzopertha dominica]
MPAIGGLEKKIVIADKLTTGDRIKLCASEFVGTAILLFLGCMGCVASITGGPIPHEQISFTFGLAVMISLQCFGHISGSHINPVVTITAAVLGNMPLVQVPIYFFGQLLGALAGFGALKVVTPSQHLPTKIVSTPEGNLTFGVCSPSMNLDLSVGQTFLVEFFASLILVFVCCGVWDKRNRDKHDSAPVRFGLAVAALAMAAGPYTGANMNPVRSFAPALLNGDWHLQWVYWIAPIAAAFFGALLYRILFTTPIPASKPVETVEGVPLNDKI